MSLTTSQFAAGRLTADKLQLRGVELLYAEPIETQLTRCNGIGGAKFDRVALYLRHSWQLFPRLFHLGRM